MELDSEPSELNYEGGEEPIYDSHQREKSTGSGLVLAVPAMVLDPEETEHEGIRAAQRGAGVVISGGEYENLVADNQYYEQVEFGKLGRQASAVMEDSLYSIPQVVSSNNSTTGLTTNMVKGMSLSALSRRLTSIRQTFSRRRQEREQEAQQHKARNIISSSQVKSVEDMYSKPNKFSLPVIPDTANPSLVIVTKKTMNMVRRQAEDDDKSYMSVHVQSAGRRDKSATRTETKNECCCCYSYCDSQKLKKYSVMFLLVSGLVTLLSLGLYFMSDNVVTVSNNGLSTVNRRNFVYDSLDSRVNRATTWKDYNQINWGTAPVRPLTTPSSSFPSLRGRSRSPSSSSSVSAAWSGWTAWSECSRNPCIKGETIARSRRCATLTGEDADMKICLGQGGVNVEMEPCFCF